MSILQKILGNNKPTTPIIKICMMGGKGAGKTSVLTSLYNNANETVAGTGLYLTPMSVTQTILSNKFVELTNMFRNAASMGDVPTGIAGDFAVSSYQFTLGEIEGSFKIELEFKDFPGETIISEPELVKGFIDEATVILIAIDTPHLMEENGRFNESRNRSQMISEFIQQHITQEEIGHKLFLLVPLKCEKYYHNGMINDVLSKVEETYSQLITLLRTSYRTEVACVITPILTLGDIVFKDFARDKDGKVLVNNLSCTNEKNSDVLPKAIYYQYRNSQAVYSPKYCEQPLCYLLSFICKENERLKRSTPNTIWGKLKHKLQIMFKLLADNPNFMLKVAILCRKMVKQQAGYKIISGRNLI